MPEQKDIGNRTQIFIDGTDITILTSYFDGVFRPNAPTLLTATTVSDTQISLEWVDNTLSVAQTEIHRSLTSGFTPDLSTLIHTTIAGATTYTDNTGTQDTKYYYKVLALEEGVQSLESNEAYAITNPLSIFKDATDDFFANTGDTVSLGDGSNTFSIMSITRADQFPPYLANLRRGTFISGTDNFFSFFDESSGTFSQSYPSIVLRDTAGSGRTMSAGYNAQPISIGTRKIFGFHRISNDVNDCRFSIEETLFAPNNIEFNDLQSTDVIQLINPVMGRRGVAVSPFFFMEGLFEKIFIVQPALSQSQLEWIVENSYQINSLTGQEARDNGIGVEGIDTIGVDGITCLVKRLWKFDLVTDSGGTDYIREEVTDDNLYAALNGFAATPTPEEFLDL